MQGKQLQLRNFKKIVLQIAIIEIIFTTIFYSGSIAAYNNEISTNNSSYPVYQVLTLTLNNKAQNGLQAQTLIFNETSKQWTINYPLLVQIQEDLNSLLGVIDGLEQITLYDYNTSYLPGCIYLLVSPANFSIAGKVTNNTIDYILSHNAVWWYVSNVQFELLDLTTFRPLDRLDTCLLGIITVINYTISSESYTGIYSYRGGVVATNILYNGSSWIANEHFFDLFDSTIDLLNDQYIFKSVGVTMHHFRREVIYSDLADFNNFSKSITVTNTTTFNTTTISLEIKNDDNDTKIGFVAGKIGGFFEEISYPSNFNLDETLSYYFVIYALFKHFWFNTFQTASWLRDSETSYPIVFSLISCSLTIFVLMLVNKSKKRTKHL